MIVGSAQCSDTIGDRVMKTQQLNNDDNSFSNPPSEEEAQCIPVVSSSHSINVSSNHHTAASQHGGSSRLSTSKESSGTSHSSSQSSYFLVSSPYLYHFLVLVLLTFAQSAGKPRQKLLLYYNLWNTVRVLVLTQPLLLEHTYSMNAKHHALSGVCWLDSRGCSGRLLIYPT